MRVEHVAARADFAARRSFKSNIENITAIERDSIREDSGLKPHLLRRVVRLVFLKDALVQRREVLLVHLARLEQSEVFERVRRPWLIQWVVAHDVGVSSEPRGNVVPKADELVLQAVLVFEEGVEGNKRLPGFVVLREISRLAVLNQWVPVLVCPEAELVQIGADAGQFVKWRQYFVEEVVDAVLVFGQDSLGVEVRNAFATHRASEHILMGVDERVDSCLAKFVDQLFNLIQVCIIVDALCAFYGFPHDAKAHKVHAPLDQIRDVFVVQRILAIEFAIRRDVRVNLVNDIHAVEKHLSAFGVHERATGGVNVNASQRGLL